MKQAGKIRKKSSERGVALLISLFAMMLICIVAIALIVSSGTESSLSGNYRSATAVYYGALAGLEEARGRLLPKNPDYFGSFVTTPGSVLAPGEVRYVINPVPGETVAPWDLSDPTTYPDTEYQTEFGIPPSSSAPWINSVWVANATTFPGPLYKWVRINAVTEQSLGRKVSGSGSLDSTTPIFYDGTSLNLSGNGKQAFEITSLAALTNGSQKVVQYVVSSAAMNLTFPAALTLDGGSVNFRGPGSSGFQIYGKDQINTPSCTGNNSTSPAIGYGNSSSPGFTSSITATPPGNYYGGVGDVTMGLSASGWPQTPSQLDNLVQTITQNADVVINGSATQANLPSSMSPSNPMTIVVQGDLVLNSWHGSGYGLLVVEGEFDYDPDANWYGIILVIGKGVFYSNRGGVGQFQGAVFVATTRDASGNLLPDPSLGTASFTQTGGGQGIYYSSCWIQASLAPSAYKVLSFREIAQ